MILAFSSKSYNQDLTYPSMKAILIYRLTSGIGFPNQDDFKTFQIKFLGEDSLTFTELQKITLTNTLKNKTIELDYSKSIDEIGECNVLYVDEINSKFIDKIWKNINQKEILLITENCTDQKYLMLNLFYNKELEKVEFEINKANILIENLTIEPELLLLGGKELDIRELYQETRNSLEETKKVLEETNFEVLVQKQLFEKTKQELDIQKKSADSLRNEITNLSEKIKNSEGKLKYLTDSIKTQQSVLNQKLEQIELQESKIHYQESEITVKESEINNQIQRLDSLIEESNNLLKIIESQKETLGTQEKLIENQQAKLLFSIIMIVVFVIIVIFISVIYKIRTNANKNLERKVDERTKELKIEIEERKKTEKELEKHKNQLEFLVEERSYEVIQKNKELELINLEQKEFNEILISQKLELENTLRKLQETQNQLVQAEKMASLGILTAGIAHEINNPINYISSGLEGLKSIVEQFVELINDLQNKKGKDKLVFIDNLENQKQFEYLIIGLKKLTRNIQNGVNRTTEIIKSLNTFSRSDEDILELTDIHKNIDSTLILLYNNYKNKVEIIKKYNKIPKIYSFSGKLNQVFMNILINAIQAIPEKGKIYLKTDLLNNENFNGKLTKFVKISITDTGVGIPKENVDKLFQPFFTTKKVGEGTGLGLSIAHGIVEKHKGRIEIKSEINKGTEFVIYLPILEKNEYA